MTLKLLIAASAALAIGACATSLQTTSGADYLARYDASHQTTDSLTAEVDEDVRRIAALEPTLAFPARIGLARIHRGTLTEIPADEAHIWQASLEDMGEQLGEIVPVSPLIAALVSDPATNGRHARSFDVNRAASVIAHIRRGAARQHLDFVLAYEVGSRQHRKANALSAADLTIIGMFVLPSRTVDVEASASALMLDVRTGYPYATLTTHAEASGLTRAVTNQSTRFAFVDSAEERAVEKLADEFAGALEALEARAATIEPAG